MERRVGRSIAAQYITIAADEAGAEAQKLLRFERWNAGWLMDRFRIGSAPLQCGKATCSAVPRGADTGLALMGIDRHRHSPDEYFPSLPPPIQHLLRSGQVMP